MILNIPARGFGPSASIPFVVTRGYSIGAGVVIDTEPDVIWTYPAGRSNTIRATDTGSTWRYPAGRSNTITANDL